MSDGPQPRTSRRKAIRVPDNREAELEDLINDPIAVLLRHSDNITLKDVHAALRRGAGARCPGDAYGGG